MKRFLSLPLLMAIMAVMFTGCIFVPETDEYNELDLVSRWKAPSDVAPESDFQYCVFQSDKDETGEYRLGYMWDEGDEVYESDLTYLGNGWFKWKLTGDELVEIHLMENGGAQIPKYYTITMLNEVTLTYEDSFGKSITWKRQ